MDATEINLNVGRADGEVGVTLDAITKDFNSAILNRFPHNDPAIVV